MSVVPAYLRDGHARYKRAERDGSVSAADLEAEAAYQKFLRHRNAGRCADCDEQLNDPKSKRCLPCSWSRKTLDRRCEMVGCDRLHVAHGLCQMHYQRVMRSRWRVRRERIAKLDAAVDRATAP